MSYLPTCTESSGNTGFGKCGENIHPVVGFVLLPRGTEIATQALVNTLATWTTGINADRGSRWYPSGKVFDHNIADDELQKIEGQFGQKLPNGITAGEEEYIFAIAKNTGWTTRIWENYVNALENGSWDAVRILKDGSIEGLSPDEIKFKGFPVDITMLLKSQGKDKAKLGVIYMTCENPELKKKGRTTLPTDFDPLTEILGCGIENVTVEYVSKTATTIVIDIKSDLDGRGIPDIVAADISISPITSITLPAVTGVTGRYTISGLTTATEYTYNLKSPALQTTKGYESVSDDVVTTTS